MPILYYKSKEEVPSDLADVAAQVTDEGDYKGQYAVNVVARKKLDEFRSNNTELAKKLEDTDTLLKRVASAAGIAKLDEFDSETFSKEITALRDTARKVADGKIKASEDVDQEVNKRTEAMRNKFDQSLQEKQIEVNQMKVERDEAVAKYKRTFIDKAVAAVIADPDLGLQITAMNDVTQKAYSVFHVEEDGSITPKEPGGQTMWGEDGTSKMTMKEWINLRLRKDSPHYFKVSNGGGANGGDARNYGGLTEAEFNKLPAQRRLEIANQRSFAKAR